MDSNREKHEFARINLVQERERIRDLIQMYAKNQQVYLSMLEECAYQAGRLDEKLEV